MNSESELSSSLDEGQLRELTIKLLTDLNSLKEHANNEVLSILKVLKDIFFKYKQYMHMVCEELIRNNFAGKCFQE